MGGESPEQRGGVLLVAHPLYGFDSTMNVSCCFGPLVCPSPNGFYRKVLRILSLLVWISSRSIQKLRGHEFIESLRCSLRPTCEKDEVFRLAGGCR